MADATFRAGGLASGMDTNSIIEQLVSLESRPLTLLQKKQAGVKSQISALGDIVSKLQALGTAARGLATDGVLAAKVTSEGLTTFSAQPGAGALSGNYAVEVKTLARAAKWRSAELASAATGLGKGTLTLTSQGSDPKVIAVTEGMTLKELGDAIRQTGLPVSATVLTGTTGTSLTLANKDSGLPLTGAALDVQWSRAAGAAGPDPGFGELETARNAVFAVDGLEFTRRSNTVTDAIPGVTLTLKKQAAAAGTTEDLVLATDVDGTRGRLQKFGDAYNDVMRLVQRQLAVTQYTDRGSTLAGDSTIRSLQARLQGVLVARVSGLPNASTLADVGLKTARDGSLSVDQTTFERAVARDPSALDALFSTANTGIADVVKALVDTETRSGDGVLSTRRTSLDRAVTRMDAELEALQRRLDVYRRTLVAQFSAMEKTVSGLKAIGSFLTQQSQAASKES